MDQKDNIPTRQPDELDRKMARGVEWVRNEEARREIEGDNFVPGTPPDADYGYDDSDEVLHDDDIATDDDEVLDNGNSS